MQGMSKEKPNVIGATCDPGQGGFTRAETQMAEVKKTLRWICEQCTETKVVMAAQRLLFMLDHGENDDRT